MKNNSKNIDYNDLLEKPKKTTVDRSLNGILWLGSSAFLNIILKITVTAILARQLSADLFGIISATMIVVSFSNVFWMVGVGPAIVQKKDLTNKHISTGFTITVVLGLLTYILLFILSPVIGTFFKINEFVVVFRVVSLVYIINSFSVVSESLLQKKMEFKKIAITRLVSYGLGYGICSIILSLLGYGVWALVSGIVLQAIIKTALALIFKPHIKTFKIDKGALKELIYFGGGHTIAKIFNNLALQGDYIVVGRYLGSFQLGLYTKAYQLLTMPADLIGKILNQVLFPAMVSIQDEKIKLKKTYLTLISFISLVTLPLSTLLIIIAPEIITLVLGDKWQGAIFPFQILTIGLYFRTAYKISDSLSRATGKVYNRAWRQAIYAFFVIFGSWIGKSWGLNGVAIAVLFSIVFNYYSMLHLSTKIIGVSRMEYFKIHFPTSIMTSIIAVTIFTLKSFFINIGIFPLGLVFLLTFIYVIVYLVLFQLIISNLISNELRELITHLGVRLSKIFRKVLLKKSDYTQT